MIVAHCSGSAQPDRGTPRKSPPVGTTTSPHIFARPASAPSSTWASSASTTTTTRTPTGRDHRPRGRPQPVPDHRPEAIEHRVGRSPIPGQARLRPPLELARPHPAPHRPEVGDRPGQSLLVLTNHELATASVMPWAEPPSNFTGTRTHRRTHSSPTPLRLCTVDSLHPADASHQPQTSYVTSTPTRRSDPRCRPSRKRPSMRAASTGSSSRVSFRATAVPAALGGAGRSIGGGRSGGRCRARCRGCRCRASVRRRACRD